MENLEISVNGVVRHVPPGTTVLQLLTELQYNGPVAVERNQQVIPRAHHSEAVLQAGDVIELVTFVGGG